MIDVMLQNLSAQAQFTHHQHTVGQWHLREFTNSNGELFCYMRDKPVKKSRPKSECWESDFYEFEFDGKKSNNDYERWLGQIENNAAPQLPILLSGTRLDRKGCSDWASYVASLFVRSPKYRTQISGAMIRKVRQQTEEPNYIRDLQYELFKKGELVPVEKLRIETDRFVKNLEDTPAFYHVLGLKRHTASLTRALLRKKWRVVQAPPEKHFLMSDCPVSTAEVVHGSLNPGAGFGKEHTLIFVPVTPQHVFIATPAFIEGARIAEPQFVDSLNLLTVRFAHHRVFAHANTPSIKAFVDHEIDQIVFGKNAFLAA